VLADDAQGIRNIKDDLARAIAVEKKSLDLLRSKVSRLSVIELGYRQCYAVAPVATDGGQSNLTLEPINLEIVRVADSEGNVYFQRILPLTIDPEQLGNQLFTEVDVLKNLCETLGEGGTALNWRELSYLQGTGKARDYVTESLYDIRHFIKTLRDILEWAVLITLSSKTGKPNFLLIRDGPLRTKFLKRNIVPRFARTFQDAYSRNGTMLVGVAKRSKTVNYLSLALTLEGILERQSPCFVEIPEHIEREAHSFDRTWVMSELEVGQVSPSFGKLHLAKLVEGKGAPIIPVDIPPWLMEKRKEVLEYLAETAKSSYPIPGYPYPLIRAHENATLSGLDVSIVEDLLKRAVMGTIGDPDKEKLLRHITIGRAIIKGGFHHAE